MLILLGLLIASYLKLDIGRTSVSRAEKMVRGYSSERLPWLDLGGNHRKHFGLALFRQLERIQSRSAGLGSHHAGGSLRARSLDGAYDAGDGATCWSLSGPSSGLRSSKPACPWLQTRRGSRRWLRWYWQSMPSFKHPGCPISVDEIRVFPVRNNGLISLSPKAKEQRPLEQGSFPLRVLCVLRV